ncbi:hypothetical protein [Sphingorhabdus lacus]|uniref:hypothetical protein n=1 Tax=Sphingorhabdus lacus TaxID=392610 RepID=UPI003593BD2E
MASSRTGGGRNPQIILENLRSRNLEGIRTAILLDDVYTSGAHMRAAESYLRSKNIKIEHAFVVARTAWKKPDNMFKVTPEIVPVY